MRGPGRAAILFVAAASLAVRGEDEPTDILDELTSKQVRGIHLEIDGDEDGRITMSELLDFHREQRRTVALRDVGGVLDNLDMNKDQKLSLDELLSSMQLPEEGDDERGLDEEDLKDRREQLEKEKLHLQALWDVEAQKFRAADADGDGNLDRAELSAHFYPETHEGVLRVVTARIFEPIDEDGDGLLTEEEWGKSDAIVAEDFQKLDKDKDGRLSIEEVMVWESGRLRTEEAMRDLLRLADADGDGHVTVDELDAARSDLTGRPAQHHLAEWAAHFEL